MGDMAELYDQLGSFDPPDPMGVGEPCPDAEWGECDGTMVRRVNRKTGYSFVGCSNYPRCRQTAPHWPERDRE